MGVNLIFKIAAVGILVSVICQVLKHSGREEQAFFDESRWFNPGAVLAGALHLSAV